MFSNSPHLVKQGASWRKVSSQYSLTTSLSPSIPAWRYKHFWLSERERWKTFSPQCSFIECGGPFRLDHTGAFRHFQFSWIRCHLKGGFPKVRLDGAASIWPFPHHSLHRFSNTSTVATQGVSWKMVSPKCSLTELSIWHFLHSSRHSFANASNVLNQVVKRPFTQSALSHSWLYGTS